MKKAIHSAFTSIVLALTAPAMAATQPGFCLNSFGQSVSCTTEMPVDQTGTYLYAKVGETFALVTNNTPSAPVTLYGGDYIFDQTCLTYGTVRLQRLGPDGVTWMNSINKTAADTTSGTGITLGAGAQVKVSLSSSPTGCSAVLSRVPN